MTSSRFLGVVVLAAALVLIGHLGAMGLTEPDEGRYTEISRGMLVSGDWIVPRQKGVPHWAKPPFTYWCVGACIGVFGPVEGSARLPSALAGIWVLLLVADIARRMGGNRAGALAAAIWASTAEPFVLARLVTTDMLLCAATTTAMWSSWRFGMAESWRWRVILGVAIGIGFLTKGPVVLGVVATGLLGARLFGARGASRIAWSLLPLSIACVIAAPWFVVAAGREPLLVDHYLGRELVGRVAGGLGRTQPWWYFLVVLPLGALPWTPWAIRATFARGAESPAPWLRGWLAGPLILFMVSASKLWTYVLPIFPAIAIITALDLARRERGRTVLWIAGLMVVVYHGVLFVAPRYEAHIGQNSSYAALARPLGADRALVGALMPDGVEPVDGPPRYPDDGLAVVTFKLRFRAAAFYALGEQAGYLPNYGGAYVWEIATRNDAAVGPTLADLRVLASRRSVLVMTKARFRDELVEALGAPTRELGRVSSENHESVALLFAP